MSDKLKPLEILVYSIKLSLLLCKLQFERNKKVVCLSEKTWISNYIIFSMPLGIAGDFDLH